ncbi:hypothetical protein C475_14468 [Halosimplex carlsbadense 2-9-1]|uniref:Uncharacterized protein n=1 Tax=Halosimplex carlsbadense 2-9-1 TaxID=797114 RepID=M0CJM3_9EURY|nr:hypothetical protein [Halosimplex carlsbadense]ELZ23485.1 hypothetical protein C475_14468 [Halosimplex carlsbadense 2-9-1]
MIPALPDPVSLEGVFGGLAEALVWFVGALLAWVIWSRVVKLEAALVERVPTKVVVGLVALLALVVAGVIPLP